MSLLVAVTHRAEKRLCEVTNLFGVDGDQIDDAATACTAVIKWDDTHWIAFSPGEPNSHFVVQSS